MKKWSKRVKVKGIVCQVVEHTDEECQKPRKDGQHLAPISHGFVCLYRNNKYEKWCGQFYAEKRIIK